jgi:two-component system NtrC family sensor kinase
MNILTIIALTSAIIYLLVACFVYFQNKYNPVNRYFALMLLCVSIWQIELAGIRGAPNEFFAETWADIFRIGLLFIPPTFLHFSLIFSSPQGLSGAAKKNLYLFYGVSCILAAISWTDYFSGEARKYTWGYSVQSGPLYFLFIFQFFCSVIFSIFYMGRRYLDSDSYQRQRIKYFFIAIGVSFILGSTNFLPVVGFEFYPFGSIAITIGLMIVAYSVAQHRLMDVSVFMAKGLGYLLSIMLFAIPAFILMVLLENYFFFDGFNSFFSIIMIAVGVIVALSFNRTKTRIYRAMHQVIVRDKYSYLQVLEEFSRRLVTIVDLNRLLYMLADTIEKSMGVKNIVIFLHDADKEAYRIALRRESSAQEMIKTGNLALKYLEEKKEAILRDEMRVAVENPMAAELLNWMEKVQAEVCLPLVYMNRMIGFINLGYKTEKEMYYQEDINLLNFVANQAAIGIENANLYENLKKSQNIMRRADRLASLGTLIASLAHEIRNPLVSIKTFTQLLPERIDDEEFRSYFLKVATGEIDRLTGLINELLGFARPSEPRPQGEDINAIIDQMEVLVSTEARKKNITLSKKYASNLPKVNVDAEQIKQVLLNILLNAIQAIKGEGKVWIETRMVQMPGEDKIDPYVQVEIRDTGVGIPKENLERIFDPFFSTRPEGSGLGLAISHQIIHEHGGFINVDSEVGKGTSFKVHLALKEGGKVAAQN